MDVEDSLAQRLLSAGQSFLAAFQIQENKPRSFCYFFQQWEKVKEWSLVIFTILIEKLKLDLFSVSAEHRLKCIFFQQ
ncbi:hypothetical protein ACFSO9_09710 [Mesonia maritima]|uniref:hypothetical protein n=1 Tax=Mesonia maritima TaxID=1793873 RepID=UPI00363C6A05